MSIPEMPPMPTAFDQDEMETWLTEVELVSEKIKKLANNEITVKEIDEAQNKINIQKEKQLQAKKDIKSEQEIQRLKDLQEGKYGKGEKKNYVSFCRYCFREYEQPKDACFWCKRPCQTYEERYADLLKRVKKYKEDKDRKKDRKQKYELQQKTQKMLWKKNSTNYNKWEYFTSSEEELPSDPIVPKDDPNFKALEMDMEQRKKKRQADAKEAETLRLKGNDYFKQEMYDHAVMKYSQALEVIKDVKSIYLNRALAYIKLSKFRKASNDCTRVIEYCECFEDGFKQSKDSCFKAFSRRALAFKNLNKLEEAKKDIEQALELIDEKEAKQLKKEIDELITTQKIIKEEKPKIKEAVDKFLQSNSLNDLLKCITDPQCRAYFYSQKGISKLIPLLDDTKAILILTLYLEEGSIYLQDFYLNDNGINLIIGKVADLLKEINAEKQSPLFDRIQDYLEILNLLDDDKIREIIQKSKLSQFLFENINLLSLYQTEPSVVNAYISLCSNICYGQSELKTLLTTNHQMLFNRLSPILASIQPLPIFQGLYNSTCNLLSNLLNEEAFRNQSIGDKIVFPKLVALLSTPMNHENNLAVFVNLMFKAQEPQKLYFEQLQVNEIFNLIHHQNKIVQERALTVLSKSNYHENIFTIDEEIIKNQKQAVKVLLNMSQYKEIVQQFNNEPKKYIQLLGHLKSLVHKEDEIWFCNACTVIGQLIDLSPLQPVIDGQNPSSVFYEIIPRLITIVRDRLGNMRKNAAILLAKLSKEPKNLQALRDLHGIEILNSVIKHLNI